MKTQGAYGGKTAALLPLCMFIGMYGSCSVDYGRENRTQELSPEFIFYDADFTRVENNKIKLYTAAQKLEQYAGADAMYGENVRFVLYDTDGQPAAEGSCGLISADREHNMYHFFSRIRIRSYEHRAEVSAENLRWNGKTQTLDSGKNDKVHIGIESSDGTLLEAEGTGFTARKKDLTFSFNEYIRGVLTETEQDGKAAQEAAENEQTESGKTATAGERDE